MFRLTADDTSLAVLGTVQGLVTERETVRERFEEFGPDVVALSISGSMLTGLKKVVEGEIEETPVSTMNEIFAAHLERFGEVQIPPPSLQEAFILARDASIPCIPVDMDDDTYDDFYLKYITSIQYFRHIGRLRKLGKRRFRAGNPQDFVREWDFRVCRLKGFRQLEEAREAAIARNIASLVGKHSRIFAVVELEREAGIISNLKKTLAESAGSAGSI